MNSPLFDSLQQRADEDQSLGIKRKFASDDARTQRYSFEVTNDVFLDFSKTHIDAEILNHYLSLAEQVGVVEKRHAFLSGEKINNSENRSVLHPLLRDTENQGISMAADNALELARDAKQQFVSQCNLVAQGLDQRATPVTDIIHVGIGGSALGTQLLFEALSGLNPKYAVHFVSNIDAHQLADVLSKCQPESTMVIGVSKTFTTAETLQNLESIGAWMQAGGIADPKANMYGVTASPEHAMKWGVPEQNVVSFPTWVGGRYSVWSSVSLSVALLIGMDQFEQFLAGGAEIDRHFYHADLADNVCFIAAALDHYYTNFMGAGTRAIFAYDHRFRSLVDYLQQLETESNGKDRKADGEPVDVKTSAVIWGGVGTDVQHSVFQMLHQGTSLIPAEFILVKNADHELAEHHKVLLANGIAQTAALLSGQDMDDIERFHGDENLSDATKKAKLFSGNRPSTTLLVDRLTPKALGSLLAFYEHRTFFGGVLAQINSFDQMGVELGKRLAKQVRPLLDEGADVGSSDFDESTKQLIQKII